MFRTLIFKIIRLVRLTRYCTRNLQCFFLSDCGHKRVHLAFPRFLSSIFLFVAVGFIQYSLRVSRRHSLETDGWMLLDRSITQSISWCHQPINMPCRRVVARPGHQPINMSCRRVVARPVQQSACMRTHSSHWCGLVVRSEPCLVENKWSVRSACCF